MATPCMSHFILVGSYVTREAEFRFENPLTGRTVQLASIVICIGVGGFELSLP